MLAATLTAGSALALGWVCRRQQRATRAARARLLDACVGLLDDPRRATSPAGFDRLAGSHRGHAVSIVLEEDHAAMRKLPSLWLHLAVSGEPLAGGASLAVLARPGHPLACSPTAEWDSQVRPLPGWPEDILCRTATVAPDLDAIDDEVRGLFADNRSKELVVTPRRVRLTWQAKEARGGDYRLLRAAVFDDEPVAAEAVAALLARALAIRGRLQTGMRAAA